MFFCRINNSKRKNRRENPPASITLYMNRALFKRFLSRFFLGGGGVGGGFQRTIGAAELEGSEDDSSQHENGHDGGLVTEGQAVDDVRRRAGLARLGHLSLYMKQRGKKDTVI